MATKSSNKNLHKASQAKKDEFYTQLVDIEKELKHYKDQFRGKVVYCNCDDPFESNFFKYFASKFNELKLKKLITTSYSGSPIVGQQVLPLEMEGLKLETKKEPYVVEITEVTDLNKDGSIGLEDVEALLKRNKKSSRKLKGDGSHTAGDFRSDECVKLLKDADIVVTNPPFSLFREYVAQLVEYKKKFLILGNKNAILYKEIFGLIKENKLWGGMMPMGYDILFSVPDEYAKRMVETGKKGSQYKIIKGVVYGRSPSMWFTNLDTAKRHERFTLYKNYNPQEYPKYDNYDAIEVSKTQDIPQDYNGVMGVPISFLDKYNPEQFEIIGSNRGVDQDPKGIYGRGSFLNGKETFKRLFIKNKKVRK